MRTMPIMTLAAATALSVPAFAQDAGSPGAVGTGRGLTGGNYGTDAQPRWDGYGYEPYDSGYGEYGTRAYPGYHDYQYGYENEPDYPAVKGGICEGRRAWAVSKAPTRYT